MSDNNEKIEEAYRLLGYYSAVARRFGAPDWGYWLSLPFWTARDAACLLSELSPDRHDMVAADINPQPRQLVENIATVERKAAREQQAGLLCASASPHQWAMWADGSGYALPDRLQRARIEHADNEAQESAAPKGGAGGTAAIEETETKNWMLLIQAEAAKRWKSLRGAGANPTKNNIKGDLATWCKETNVLTDGGINPTAEYIYRHVLRKWEPPKG